MFADLVSLLLGLAVLVLVVGVPAYLYTQDLPNQPKE